MTKKQILTAWSKSSNREQTTHKQFDEKMVQKTLVNSGCNMIINSTPEYQVALDEDTQLIEGKLPEVEEADYEEVHEPTIEAITETTMEEPASTSKVIDDTEF